MSEGNGMTAGRRWNDGNTVDQQARDDARSALAKLDSHEAVCAERWRHTNELLATLSGRWWWLLVTSNGFLVTALMGVVIWAAKHGAFVP